jgi:hypothetical protein
MENLLIEIHLFVCQIYDTSSATCYQRLSNNRDPELEAEYRIAEIRKVHEQYIDRIADFNHVLLNTAYPEDLFDQMFEL